MLNRLHFQFFHFENVDENARPLVLKIEDKQNKVSKKEHLLILRIV